MPAPIASRTSSRRVSAWTRAATARASTRSATPTEMHPGLRARFRVSVRHRAEETGRRLDRDGPAAPRLDLRRRPPQGARRLPAATRTMKVAANPGDPYGRHRRRSRPREDRAAASNVHTGRGGGSSLQISTPPHARLRGPASCTSMHTARGAPRINSPTFGLHLRPGRAPRHPRPGRLAPTPTRPGLQSCRPTASSHHNAWLAWRPPLQIDPAGPRTPRPPGRARRRRSRTLKTQGRQVAAVRSRRASVHRNPNPWPGTRRVHLPGADGPSA